MFVLDTNHIEAIGRRTAAGLRLVERLESSGRETATTVVTVEENLRGWLAEIRRHPPTAQVYAYQRLLECVEFYAERLVLPWDADSANLFVELRKQKINVPTLDLKIACITLAHDATLLTRNTSDFAPVPGLRFENWLD